jgi:hypothetical protein
MRWSGIGAAFGLGPPAGAAEDPVEMQVVGYDTFHARAKFRILPTENTELASCVQARLKETLARHGFTYGQSAHLVMTVTAEKLGGERPPVMSFDPSTSQLHVGIDTSKPPLHAQMGHQYRISLDLYDRQSGRYLWRGRIADMKPDVDPFAATKPMIERLVKAMALWAGPTH